MSTKTGSTSAIHLEREILELQDRNRLLEQAITSRHSIEKMFSQYGDDVILRSINAGLQAVSETNNVWQAVHAILRNQIRAEHDSALMPDLTNEALRANVARLASLEDLQNNLFKVWAESNKISKQANT